MGRRITGLCIVILAFIALGRPALADSAPEYLVRWSPPSHVRDQGQDPDCVAAAWDNWLETAPHAVDASPWSDWSLYKAAQQVDEWPNDDYDGTSIEAGAKVLQDAGLISDVRFTPSYTEATQFLLSDGPVVVSAAWWNFGYDDEFHALLNDHIVGYHAWMCFGVMANGDWACRQSWGEDWANHGDFYVTPRFLAYEALYGAYFGLAHKATPAGGVGSVARAV